MRATTHMTLAGVLAFLASANPSTAPAPIVGTWSYSTSAKPQGSAENLYIYADGSFKREVRLQQSQNTCSTTLVMTAKGHVRTEGSQLVFERESGHLSSKDNCHARFNYQRPASHEVISYDAWTVEDSQLLLMSQGKLKYRYQRKT